MPTLVLLRHGQSEWNLSGQFTGWVDVGMTAAGAEEARRAGALLRDAGLLPEVCHTSVQRRAIETATIALDVCDRLWVPVRRSWRLNERHYGALQGKDKAATLAEYGEQQFMTWRRSYDVRPPPLDADAFAAQRRDPRYATLPPDLVPASECLADVLVRMLPWWYDAIVPDLQAGRLVLVSAHGNSLRALVKHLDQLSEAEVVALNIPTGVPLRYQLDADMRPTAKDYLDPAAAEAGAAAVAAQGR